jgi:DNA-directed RNA polymerase subunit F
MEQVRELLFGTQMKEVDIRFQRQDERFERKIADVREALKTRLDSLENFMKSEMSSLLHRLKEEQSERDSALKDEQRERVEGLKSEQHERSEGLKNEQRERAEALAHLAKELASAVETFERKNSKVADTLDATERELRQLMMTENTALSSKIEEKYQDALSVLSRTAEQIRHDMVYRSSLSGMFTETALKLSGQWSDVSKPPEREAPAKGGEETPSSDDA